MAMDATGKAKTLTPLGKVELRMSAWSRTEEQSTMHPLQAITAIKQKV